jgi:hypothetical protein
MLSGEKDGGRAGRRGGIGYCKIIRELAGL